MRTEPRTIINFLSNYFDIVRELFDIQMKDGLIKTEELNRILSENETDIENKLIEYKFLKKISDDYEIRPVYFKFLEFILSEFKPLLPETIEKYEHSITSLFKKIKEGISKDRNILLQRITDLNNEVRDFTDAVEKNTIRLISETKELKANVDKIDYREKVRKASFWIDYYIKPLNTILDVSHSQSITNRLLDISQYINIRRLNFEDEVTRQQFEKLYTFLVQINDDLLKQSKILTNELLPLIERIRSESLILTGWIEFLKNPNKCEVPHLTKAYRKLPQSNNPYHNALEYVEQFLQSNEIYLNEPEDALSEKWIFNKDFYLDKLKKELPQTNFFDWAGKTLRTEYKAVETEKFFSLTSLLFEEDIDLEFDNKADRQIIRTTEMNLRVPKIKVKRHGLS
ncbi:MAG: hypothetical protein ACK5FU_09380 [Bacteroidota bacterium]|jgi:hypothetical protein|nr:hypothetical protein [Sphingobacteriales bacterium]